MMPFFRNYIKIPTDIRCLCQSSNWNEPHFGTGTPRFGILTYPYPYRYGESPYQYGDCSFFVFFSHAEDRPFLTKNLGNPNAMAHLSSPKFRQPTHCARKSRIRRTREGAASPPHITDGRCCAARGTHHLATTSAIPISNYNPQFDSINPQFNSAATEQWLAAKLGHHPARRTHQLP